MTIIDPNTNAPVLNWRQLEIEPAAVVVAPDFHAIQVESQTGEIVTIPIHILLLTVGKFLELQGLSRKNIREAARAEMERIRS